MGVPARKRAVSDVLLIGALNASSFANRGLVRDHRSALLSPAGKGGEVQVEEIKHTANRMSDHVVERLRPRIKDWDGWRDDAAHLRDR